MMEQQQRQEDLGREEQRYAQDYNLKQKTLALQNKQARMGMGIEAAKLGLNVASTFKTPLGGEGGMFSGLGGEGAKGAGSAIAGLKPGALLGAGLAGFGASRLLGSGKSKTKKAGIGAVTGGLLGFASSGSGGGLGGAIGGAISGAIGGLF
jgi:hypothetical protein